MNRRCWLKMLDAFTDAVILTVMTVVFIIGCYLTADSTYVFSHSAYSSVGRYLTDDEDISEEIGTLSADAAGWLILDDTGISYPVMQGKNNTDYLNKDPYGNFSLAGSIFLDSRNSRDFSDQYSLLYGHHMANEAMLGPLDHYYDEEYFLDHRSGKLYAGAARYELMIFAILNCDARESAVFDPGSKRKLLNYARKTALYYCKPEEGRILGISTCNDQGTMKRTVLLASMRETEVDDETD